MRILLCHQPEDGGVGRHVHDIAAGCVARGHEVVLCSPRRPSWAPEQARHVSLELRRAIAPRQDPRAVIRFRQIVRSVAPDAIHAHSSKAGAVARLARAWNRRVPLVYTPHGFAFAGHFPRRVEQVAYRELEHALAPLATRIVCVCDAEARLARQIGDPTRVRVVHNGVAVSAGDRRDPRVAELASNGPVIGVVTQLRPGKGVETLIDAVPSVLRSHPQAQIAIVGDGPDLDGLRRRASVLGIAHAVRFTGPAPNGVDAMRAMDVFAYPSWAESLPYAILEAMSVARPIVATAVGGVPEAIADARSGLIVPPEDSARLSSAIVSLLDDPHYARQLGAEALRDVSTRFTESTMLDGLLSVYEDLVPRPSEREP